jgi:hypothetical protein
MRGLRGLWLQALRPTFAPLLDTDIPSGVSVFLESGNALKVRWMVKFYKRLVVHWIIGRLCGLVRYGDRVVTGAEKKILWINLSAPSLGDAMVDLAPVRMLSGMELWLLTSAKNAFLFDGAKEFHWVGSSTKLLREASGSAFDLVIVDSLSPRVLGAKIRVAPTVRFCSIYGFVNGFDIHRLEFGCDRVASIFSRARQRGEIPLLGDSAVNIEYKMPSSFIVIAVGGEWDFRTYKKWPEVIRLIRKRSEMPIVLVGSNNGTADAEAISAAGYSEVINVVGRTGFHEAVAWIKNAELFVGADGGLWHASCAVGRPSVVLFAECEIYNRDGSRCLRIPLDKRDCVGLYDDVEVSRIEPSVIANAALRFLAKADFDNCSKYRTELDSRTGDHD